MVHWTIKHIAVDLRHCYCCTTTAVLLQRVYMGQSSPEDICNKMTGVDSAFWASTPETLSKCRTLMEREFQTWSADRLVYAQITLIITIVVNIIFCCCCSRSRTLWGNAPVNGLQYIIVPPSGLGASQPTITLEELRTLFMQMKQSQTQ